MRNTGGKIFRGRSVRTISRWHMMLGGISKQQVRVPRSPSHGPVKKVTLNTDASLHWFGNKLLMMALSKGTI